MATLTVVYWRDIPAEVIVKEGRMSARRQLYGRLLEAIDRTAMRSDSYDTDSYLAPCRYGNPEPCGDNLEAEADDARARLEAALRRCLPPGPDRGWRPGGPMTCPRGTAHTPSAAGPCIKSIQRINENLGVSRVRVMA